MNDIFLDCGRSIEAIGTGGIERLRGSHLFLTGATGFVGTWLLAMIAYLNDSAGFDVTVTGIARRPTRLEERAPFLARRRDIKLIQADVRQLIDLPDGTNWIVNAAGDPDSRHHATNPIDTAAVIGEGTLRVLRLAERATDLRNLLHFSSGLAGMPHQGRMTASSVYMEAKRFSEALCAAFRNQARLPIVVTRPFTFLGPFQALDAPWAANNFLHAALNAQPLKLLGGGETARAYLYGSDMAALVLHQLVRGESGETFDLGGVEPVTLIELARMVAGEARRPLEIRVNTGSRDAGDSRFVPDMRSAQDRLGFRPAISVPAAIARTLRWHKDRAAATDATL